MPDMDPMRNTERAVAMERAIYTELVDRLVDKPKEARDVLALQTAVMKALTTGVHIARMELTAQSIAGHPPTLALRPLTDELEAADLWASAFGDA